eukprot:1354868-Amphidinium_carterae.1
MELSAWSGSLIDGELFSNMDEAWATGDLSIMQPQQKFFAILPGLCYKGAIAYSPEKVYDRKNEQIICVCPTLHKGVPHKGQSCM